MPSCEKHYNPDYENACLSARPEHCCACEPEEHIEFTLADAKACGFPLNDELCVHGMRKHACTVENKDYKCSACH